MRAVITRVLEASVSIGGQLHSTIGRGFLVLLGVKAGDTALESVRIADRICGLRIFEDSAGKMNLDPKQADAEFLFVSQFTLYGDTKQRRPGFTAAAKPDEANILYEMCVSECRARGFTVKTGVFGADMQVSSVNDGPVTILLDTEVQ